MHVIEEYTRGVHTIRIWADDDYVHLWDEWMEAASTGEHLWDLAHSRMNLPVRRRGDPKTYWEFPVYMYEHGNRTVSLAPFSCGWDSGRLGTLSIRRKRGLTGRKAEAMAKSLVTWLDDLLQGNVYGFTILRKGEEVMSVGGFIGDVEDIKREAEREAA